MACSGFIAPDGQRIAVDVVTGTQAMQVWLYELALGTLTPFTFEGLNRHATWTPDGERIVFMSNREGVTQLYWQPIDGSRDVERLTQNAPVATADILDVPYSWSPGDLLMFGRIDPTRIDPTKGPEFWLLDVTVPAATEGQRGMTRLQLDMRSPDGGPQFSPDKRLLAYAADDDMGRRQIYVQAYPGPGGRRRVSDDGGNEPLWNPNGRELFYRQGDDMMVVDIAVAESGFTVDKPRRLFSRRYLTTTANWVRPNYDVTPDGQRFLMLKPTEQEELPLTKIEIVLNWSDEVARLVPTQ